MEVAAKTRFLLRNKNQYLEQFPRLVIRQTLIISNNVTMSDAYYGIVKPRCNQEFDEHHCHALQYFIDCIQC